MPKKMTMKMSRELSERLTLLGVHRPLTWEKEALDAFLKFLSGEATLVCYKNLTLVFEDNKAIKETFKRAGY